MFCLEDNTERSESNPGRSLGIKTKEGGAVWKTVPCRCMLTAFFICFGTVFQTVLFVILYIPRLRPGLLSLRSVLASSQSYRQPTTYNLQPITKHQQPNTYNLSLFIDIVFLNNQPNLL